jgi:NitT/TauT family transport system substrate-binding protein
MWTDHTSSMLRCIGRTTRDQDTTMDTLRISATGHGINYLPEYYAAATGGFERRGLTVVATAHDPWDGVIHALDAGEADLVLGGIWAPAMYAGAGRDLVAIGQLNARFPKAIVTREPVEDFTWSWMTGRTVHAPGQGGTASYEFTAGVMREHGVDPAQTKFVRDLSTSMLRELYEHGLGDAFIADTITATSMRRSGSGHVAHDFADSAGPMPNSVYYTDRSRLDEVHDRAVALMAAIDEAMHALSAGADPTAVIAAEWPHGDQQAFGESAAILAANGTWSGIAIEPAALDRWVGFLHERGLCARHASYDELVDAGVAAAALAEGATS